MNKKYILPIALILGVILLTGFVLAMWNSNTNEITIPIKSGWNLIPAVSGEIGKTDSPIKITDFKYIFFYDVDDNKYVLTMKDGNPTQRNFDLGPWSTDIYVMHTSVWAYSEKEGDLILRWGYPGFNSQWFELPKYNLVKGWNFIFRTPNMKGVTFGDFKGTCNVQRLCSYDRNNWGCMSGSQISDTIMIANSDSDAGQTIVIKVSDNCNLGENAISPPAIPIDLGSCNDSDGGKNYNVKGITSGINTDGTPFDFEDGCEVNNTKVHEYYCKEPNLNGNVFEKRNNDYFDYTCPNGCSNGACTGKSAGSIQFIEQNIGQFKFDGLSGQARIENQYSQFPLDQMIQGDLTTYSAGLPGNSTIVKVVIIKVSGNTNTFLEKVIKTYTDGNFNSQLLSPPAYPIMYKLNSKTDATNELALWMSSNYLVIVHGKSVFIDGSNAEQIIEDYLNKYPSTLN